MRFIIHAYRHAQIQAGRQTDNGDTDPKKVMVIQIDRASYHRKEHRHTNK